MLKYTGGSTDTLSSEGRCDDAFRYLGTDTVTYPLFIFTNSFTWIQISYVYLFMDVDQLYLFVQGYRSVIFTGSLDTDHSYSL